MDFYFRTPIERDLSCFRLLDLHFLQLIIMYLFHSDLFKNAKVITSIVLSHKKCCEALRTSNYELHSHTFDIRI